jgi:Zn-dependent alcohol dehydrogenase
MVSTFCASAGSRARQWAPTMLKLSEINEGFANMKAGKTLRSVIMFDA